MPYQFDVYQRIPYPDTDDGHYYWSNAWIINVSTDAEASAAITPVRNAARGILARPGEMVRMDLKRTPGMGGVYQTVNLGLLSGGRLASPNGYNMLLYCRVLYYVGDELVGYRRARMPWSIEHYDGAYWTTDARNMARGGSNNLIADGLLAARDGRVIDRSESDPLVRMWQLRHGTKRRNRAVTV